jgi:hypothetical protein
MSRRTSLLCCLTSSAALAQILTEKHVLALPVYDTRTRKYSSFIDMLDIAKHVTDKGTFDTVTCGEVADASSRNPFHAIEDRTTLDAAIYIMLHRKVKKGELFRIDDNEIM